jgi:hypothetical protein
MQSSVKDTYMSVQSRIMYFAFALLTGMSVIMIVVESYIMANPDSLLTQVIVIMNIFLGIMYSMVAMMMVEIVYQDEFHQFPLVGRLARLTPDLTIIQRYTFLSLIFKRQITSVVSLMVTWVVIGNTPRANALVISMTLITMFTAYGMAHLKTLPPPPSAPPASSSAPLGQSTEELIEERMAR